MAEQIFDSSKEAQKILDVANKFVDAGTKEQQRESAEAFDKLRGELCGLSPRQFDATINTLLPRSDDAWVSKDKDGKITSLNFRVTDYGFVGMDLSCRR